MFLNETARTINFLCVLFELTLAMCYWLPLKSILYLNLQHWACLTGMWEMTFSAFQVHGPKDFEKLNYLCKLKKTVSNFRKFRAGADYRQKSAPDNHPCTLHSLGYQPTEPSGTSEPPTPRSVHHRSCGSQSLAVRYPRAHGRGTRRWSTLAVMSWPLINAG